jgi:hypothetical protein
MNSLPEFDVYAELGVQKTAKKDEIAQAHRAMARKYHPDIHHPPEVAAELTLDPDRYKRIEQAWEVLDDDKMRHLYDEREAMRAAAVPETATISSGLFLDIQGWSLKLGGGMSWGEDWMALLDFFFLLRGHLEWKDDYPLLVRACGWLDWIYRHAWSRYAAITFVSLVVVYVVISFLWTF